MFSACLNLSLSPVGAIAGVRVAAEKKAKKAALALRRLESSAGLKIH